MFEIGISLREARERRRLGYDQVEAETKIRAKYVRALEDEQFDVLPSGTYVKGFLRTYADYLGLNGQLYVDEYSSRYGDIAGDDLFPRRRERPVPQRRESSNAVLVALAGIVALFTLFIVAWRFGTEERQPQSPLLTTISSPDLSQPSTTTSQSETETEGIGNPMTRSGHDGQGLRAAEAQARHDARRRRGRRLLAARRAAPTARSSSIARSWTARRPSRSRGTASRASTIAGAGVPAYVTVLGQRRPLEAQGQGAVAGHDARRGVLGRQDAGHRQRRGHRVSTPLTQPTAAILVTGSELLLGLIADRNSGYLARELDALGIELRRVLTVGDGLEEIAGGAALAARARL